MHTQTDMLYVQSSPDMKSQCCQVSPNMTSSTVQTSVESVDVETQCAAASVTCVSVQTSSIANVMHTQTDTLHHNNVINGAS